ncbi:MAG: DUF4286 family protein [Woeseiaceae bacterium]
MQENFGPVYEVTHHVDPAIVDDFDAWLAQHVEEMLDLPGIVRASTYAADEDDQGRPQRVTLYLFDSDTALDEYLAGPAATMRQVAKDRFPEQFDVSRRILHETEVVDGEIRPSEECLNCNTILTGQYCGNCGQRARNRLISIWELLQEAFGDLLELDSRLWRTLIPLTIRPGKLTRDYLEGRRARFMPPFRTYLFLSILFFLIAFFDPREELGIFFEPEAEAVEESSEDSADAAQSAEEIRDEVISELVAEGVLTADEAEDERREDSEDAAGEDDDAQFRVSIDGQQASSEDECADIDLTDAPPWLTSRLTKERLQAVCERMVADDGRAFLGKLLDNVPAGLFFLLPLMALILKILYPLSKRYYVEHLLFVVHYHAFIFLILSMQILFSRLAALANFADGVTAITIFAVSLYIPVYLYKGMRQVYEQGHLLTTLKFLMLVLSYFAGLSIILLFAALFAAFAI